MINHLQKLWEGGNKLMKDKEYISTYPRVTVGDLYKLTDERGYSHNGFLSSFDEGQFIHETLLRLKELEKQIKELQQKLG